MEKGVFLGGRKTAPCKIFNVRTRNNQTSLKMTIHEGRKRQIRRVAAQLDYAVIKLVRMKIGPIELGNLRPGQWRHLQGWEINSLRQISRSKPKTKRPYSQGQKKKKRSGPPQVKREDRKKGGNDGGKQ